MEINGRVWARPLAVLAGMDFPARLAELLIGDSPASSLDVIVDRPTGEVCALEIFGWTWPGSTAS